MSNQEPDLGYTAPEEYFTGEITYGGAEEEFYAPTEANTYNQYLS